MRLFRPSVLLLAFTLLVGACTRKTVSFDSRPDQHAGLALTADSLTQNQDTTGIFGKRNKRVTLSKEQELRARDKAKAAQKKKPKKNIFLGQPIKKAFVKSGPKGKNQIVEIFYFMKAFQEPNPYAPARYYFSPRQRKIFKASGDLNPATDKVLHGPYKKLQGGKVIETGYFAVGTRHLRWERTNRDNILLNKTHYEMGFPRDAAVTYYDADQKHVKEVIPYVNGRMEGEYVRFLENGQRDWDGQFENGKKVGEWNKYWGFRNRRHYQYQYAENGYEPEAEPVLYKQYNRNGVLVYEKDKLDKRDSVTDRPGSKPAINRTGGRR